MSQTFPKINAIGAVFVGGESNFGTTASNMDYFRTRAVDLGSLEVNAIENAYMKAGDFEVARIIGAYTGTVTLTVDLFGYSSSIPTTELVDHPAGGANFYSDVTQASATAHDHLSAMLASALGSLIVGGYATDETGSTTAIVSATGFTEGQAIAWDASATSTPAWRMGWIKTVNAAATPDDNTLIQQMPAPDGSGGSYNGKVYGGVTIFRETGDVYHDEDSAATANGGATTANTKSWTIEVEGHDGDNKIRCLGCQPTGVTINWATGEIPTAEITFGIAHWEEVGSGGSPSVESWSFPDPEPVMNSYAGWGADASTASLLLNSLSIDFGITRNAMQGISGESGIVGWHTPKRTPTVSFQVYRDYSEEVTLFEAQTTRTFTAQIGTQPGRMFGVLVPAARVSAYPAPAEADGASVSDVVLECGHYSGDTTAHTEGIPSNTSFRIAMV